MVSFFKDDIKLIVKSHRKLEVGLSLNANTLGTLAKVNFSMAIMNEIFTFSTRLLNSIVLRTDD